MVLSLPLPIPPLLPDDVDGCHADTAPPSRRPDDTIPVSVPVDDAVDNAATGVVNDITITSLPVPPLIPLVVVVDGMDIVNGSVDVNVVRPPLLV